MSQPYRPRPAPPPTPERVADLAFRRLGHLSDPSAIVETARQATQACRDAAQGAAPPPLPPPHDECAGKAAYATAGLARDVAQRMRRRDEGNAMPYRCANCHAWHVGSSLGNRHNRQRRKR
jgi:hypothetical protein